MSTLKLSFAAAAVLAAAIFTYAQNSGEPLAGSPEPSNLPCSHCAEEIQSETCTPALASALAVQTVDGKPQAPPPAAANADFRFEGMFVDCCSCKPPCPCELTEVAAGCKGVGVHEISSGSYAGIDLVGVRIAHAKVVGQWVNLYIDAKDEKQRAAAEKFGRAAFSKFGPIKVVKAAKIEVSGTDGKYTATVDGGKIMKFETEPVLGGDDRTPIGYVNIKNAVNPTVFQGMCVSAAYSDGDDKVTVQKGRNSHFNPKLRSGGKI